MADNVLLTEVILFLANFKRCNTEGNVDYSELKMKTSTYLRSIGWTYKAMSQYIMENIEPKHYFRGPSKHHFLPNRTVMEFGMVHCGVKLYVKLELIFEESFVAGYMSFHPCEREIKIFPLDETGKVV